MKKLLLAICGVIVLSACGGGGATTAVAPPAISVSISPSTQTNIDQGQTVKFTATAGKRLERQGSDLERFRDGAYGHGLRDLHQHDDERGNV